MPLALRERQLRLVPRLPHSTGSTSHTAQVTGTFRASSVSCAVNENGAGQDFVHRDRRKPKTSARRCQPTIPISAHAPTPANGARLIVVLILVAPNVVAWRMTSRFSVVFSRLRHFRAREGEQVLTLKACLPWSIDRSP